MRAPTIRFHSMSSSHDPSILFGNLYRHPGGMGQRSASLNPVSHLMEKQCHRKNAKGGSTANLVDLSHSILTLRNLKTICCLFSHRCAAQTASTWQTWRRRCTRRGHLHAGTYILSRLCRLLRRCFPTRHPCVIYLVLIMNATLTQPNLQLAGMFP